MAELSPPNPARERFAEIAQRADEEIDLGEAALWLAAEAFPGLPVDAYLAKLDRIADGVLPALQGVGLLEQQVEALNREIFGAYGFHGARDDYYDHATASSTRCSTGRRGFRSHSAWCTSRSPEGSGSMRRA